MKVVDAEHYSKHYRTLVVINTPHGVIYRAIENETSTGWTATFPKLESEVVADLNAQLRQADRQARDAAALAALELKAAQLQLEEAREEKKAVEEELKELKKRANRLVKQLDMFPDIEEMAEALADMKYVQLVMNGDPMIPHDRGRAESVLKLIEAWEVPTNILQLDDNCLEEEEKENEAKA